MICSIKFMIDSYDNSCETRFHENPQEEKKTMMLRVVLYLCYKLVSSQHEGEVKGDLRPSRSKDESTE